VEVEASVDAGIVAGAFFAEGGDEMAIFCFTTFGGAFGGAFSPHETTASRVNPIISISAKLIRRFI